MWWFRKPYEAKPGTYCARFGHFFASRYWTQLFPDRDPACQVCGVRRSELKGF
jgi:hypothetical protein